MFFTHFIRQAILRFNKILLANLAVPPWHMKYLMDLFSVAKFMSTSHQNDKIGYLVPLEGITSLF